MPSLNRIPYIVYGYALLFIAVAYSVEADLGHFKMNLPSEPLIVLLGFILLRQMDWKMLWDSSFIRHPLTLLSSTYLFWMGLTIPFSSDSVVSLKYFIIAIAHYWVFYIGFWYVSRKTTIESTRFLSFYALVLMPLIIYTWWVHGTYDFRIDAAVLSARPFIKDNTLYGLILSMLFLPLVYSFVKMKTRKKWFLLGVSTLLGLALFSSFCRAAWLSVLLSVALLGAVVVLKLDFKRLLSLVILGGISLVFLFPLLESNSVSKKGGVFQQLQSVTNIKTDVSNLERVNRYKCAWRMFKKRPVTGFGAGTYPRAYLPFQKKEEMTRLSVTTIRRTDGNEHHSGRGGSTHSEYLRALSELGLLGFLCWVGFCLGSLFYGIKIFNENEGKKKQQSLVILLGLLPFFIHVLFNNFSHQEEAVILFWALLSGLVILDVESSTI